MGNPRRGLVVVLVIGLLMTKSVVAAAAPVTTTDLGSVNLRQGDTGRAVRALQSILVTLGYSPGPVDGIFGIRTSTALRTLQSDLHLMADGVVGPSTRSAMASREHTVRRGDTVFLLATRYGAPVDWIARSNNLDNPNWIHPGQQLWIPIRRPVAAGGGAAAATADLRGHHIIVDAGHGGSNPGALGVNGLKEKEVTLDVSLRLKELLQAAGATVTMTRASDYAPSVPGYPGFGQLAARTLIANQSGGDIFVSIHSNWYGDPHATGIMVFVHHDASRTAWVLAQNLYRGTVASSGMRAVDLQGADFYVLRETTMPAVLMELGFLSNWSDAQKLNRPAFRQQLAEGLYNGILAFYRSK